MSFKIRLPDDNLLEIDIRKDADADDAVPIEDVVSETETASNGRRTWSRRLFRVAAVGALVAGGAVAVRRLLRGRSDRGMDIEVDQERTTSA